MDVTKVAPRFGFRFTNGQAIAFDEATSRIIMHLQMTVGAPDDLTWGDNWTTYLNEVYPKINGSIEQADSVLMRAFFNALNAGNNPAASELLKLGMVNRAIGELFAIYVLPSQN